MQLLVDVAQYTAGKNPYDSWMGRELISKKKWEAGGMVRFGEFLKQQWNRQGGSILYYFPYDDLDKIQGDLEKWTRKPIVGNYLRRFLRVSNRGLYESYTQSPEMVEEKQRSARERLAKDELVIDLVNSGLIKSREDAHREYLKQKQAGNDLGRFQDFWERITRTQGRKKDDVLFQSLQYKTTRERAIILKKALNREVDLKEAARIFKEMKREMVED